MNRRLGLLLALLTLPVAAFAAETQRYLIAAPQQATASSKLRVAANFARFTEDAERRPRTFRNVDAIAANLTEEEARELRNSGQVLVEPIVERHVLDEGDSMPVGTPVGGLATEPQSIPWGIGAVHAADVWPHTRGQGVNVAVMDTGINYEHADLRHAYAGGHNAIDPLLPPMDGHRHGTHVAGTIAAADNTFGVVGVAPSVRLWAVKVLGDNGKGTNENVIAGIDWVIEQSKTVPGRWVMNFSLGSTAYSATEAAIVARAIASGIVIVASAGNKATDTMKWPALYDDVISVGAIDKDFKRAAFSSYGSSLSIMAPGADVRSTIIPGIDESAAVSTATEALAAWQLKGSPYGSIASRIVDCGYGEPHEFPWDVSGRIAFIRRGKIPFREMARNAKTAGAVAVVIQTYESDRSPSGAWTLPPVDPSPEWENYQFPLTVGVLYSVGEKLLAAKENVTVAFTSAEYGEMNGTSMAAPHVSGIVALMLALAPATNVSQIEYVLRQTAHDIATPGWDYETSWGVIDALAAAKYIAYEKFNLPPPVPKPTGRRRAVGGR